MSRNHAIIFFDDNKFYIRDLNSSNGTLVNTSPVSSSERTEIFSDDVLQFGVMVGCHLPVRTRVEFYSEEDVKYRGRDSTLQDRDQTRQEDLDNINNSISNMEHSEQLVSRKLEKLETIIDNIKNIYTKSNQGTEILHKLQIITKSMDNLNALISNKIFDQKDIEHSIKNILNDLIKEVVLNNLVQEEKQRELLDYVMKKLEETPQLTEEKIVINTNMKSDPADQERSSSPIVFYQDDDIPELICSPDDFDCQRTKSILKPPRSPKISLNRIRINVVPEVREIENVLDQEDGDTEDTHHHEKQVRTLSEGESPEPEVAPIPAPRKRSWAKRVERSQSVEASELKLQQQKSSEMTIKPGDFQALKEKREETIREDRKEVQVTFNHDSTFCIQGLIFTIMFGFMIIFFGLEKNPAVVEFVKVFTFTVELEICLLEFSVAPTITST